MSWLLAVLYCDSGDIPGAVGENSVLSIQVAGLYGRDRRRPHHTPQDIIDYCRVSLSCGVYHGRFRKAGNATKVDLIQDQTTNRTLMTPLHHFRP